MITGYKYTYITLHRKHNQKITVLGNEKGYAEKASAWASKVLDVQKLHRAMGNLKAALPLATMAPEVREAVLGPQHPDTATALGNLALLHKAMGCLVPSHCVMSPIRRQRGRS